jgi:ATP-dependent Lon protease
MEVLDPVQNHAFRDTYLELDYDLSHVLFIATANYEEDIPETLHDRLEVIRIPGYTSHEKEEIGRRHLVPRLASESGLKEAGAVLTRPALRSIIESYTREAGVRELARLAGKIFRKLARLSVEGKPLPKRIGPRELERFLGAPLFLKARLEEEPPVGVGIGLAYTGAGGDILRIETAVMPGKGDFHLTGQLGEVMQESVTAAWGYLKTAIPREPLLQKLWDYSPGRAYLAEHFSSDGDQDAGRAYDDGQLALDLGEEVREPSAGGPGDHELLSSLEVRMHLPEGAVPKEGPSAGLAVAASLLSALLMEPLQARVALSGEITLTGQILAVGGLKEKILAARREGVRKVVLPGDVRGQMKELPAELTAGLELIYVSTFLEALPHILSRFGEAEHGALEAVRDDEGEAA